MRACEQTWAESDSRHLANNLTLGNGFIRHFFLTGLMSLAFMNFFMQRAYHKALTLINIENGLEGIRLVDAQIPAGAGMVVGGALIVICQLPSPV